MDRVSKREGINNEFFSKLLEQDLRGKSLHTFLHPALEPGPKTGIHFWVRCSSFLLRRVFFARTGVHVA
jgi:hypothetical protein